MYDFLFYGNATKVIFAIKNSKKALNNQREYYKTIVKKCKICYIYTRKEDGYVLFIQNKETFN